MLEPKERSLHSFKYGKDNPKIYGFATSSINENKDEMEETTNSLQHFLKSGKVILSSESYIPEKIFKQAFNDHCRENNLSKEQFTSDYYKSIFINS